MSIYRHYGYGKINLVNVEGTMNSMEGSAINGSPSKPKGFSGFWASPINSKYPWEEFRLSECCGCVNRFNQAVLEKSYVDVEIDDSKIYHIFNINDLLKYCLNLSSKEEYLSIDNQYYHLNGERFIAFVIDFDRMREDGFSGCEYHYSADQDMLNRFMYWDCDSVVVWDMSIVSSITYSPTHKSEFIVDPSLYSEEDFEYYLIQSSCNKSIESTLENDNAVEPSYQSYYEDDFDDGDEYDFFED